jgi:hypothetical protein
MLRSVRYRRRSVYAQRGDVNSCGDWLAVALKEHCHSGQGFDVDKFERVLKENDIEWEHQPENSRLDWKVSYEWASEAGSSCATNELHSSQR